MSNRSRRHLTYNIQLITVDAKREGNTVYKLVHRSLAAKQFLVLVEDVAGSPRQPPIVRVKQRQEV
ncbi:hypothetical protein TGAMA5MH_03879 [Trichoderma gamsii]|uniref:Uncharacterized protein n=1 Tax=Trichoderma gamsii TaxID=398673 RepID=A0A2K0TFH0_9HYPO|nr:hypothetical protein TGAMA5MH_03879 [Trichoderma gamsii]